MADNRGEAQFLADYLTNVLRAGTATVVRCPGDYGQTLAADFSRAYRKVHAVFGPDDAAVRLKADPHHGAIVVACPDDAARRVVTQIREHGVTSLIVGGDTLGTDDFLTRLPPAAATDVYAASPLILDSVAGPGLQWLRTYRARYPTPPPAWDAATTEAAFAVLTAAMGSGLSWTASSRTADRVRIKDGLAAISTPATAVVTALGPIYFDETRSATVTLTMGKVDPNVGLVSAPTQLVAYSPRAGVNIDQEVAAGHAVRHGSTILVRQQVVATGINFNELSELDTVAGRFDADFFIWFRYAGGDEPVAVVFTNSVGDVSLGNPIRSSTSDGLSYRLYRVRGTFKAPMNFHRFPFDEQRLEIVVQNRSTPASRVVYVGDRAVLRQNSAERLASGVDRTATINQLPSWTIRGLTFNPNTVGSTALLGDPTLTTENSGFFYAQYVAQVTIARDVAPFLVKNMLPLLLLIAVTYVSLFFPHGDTGTRVSFGVTGILSAAVLLNAVTSVLPNVSYTVAIEWGYYAFILLAALCVLSTMFGGKLEKREDTAALRRLTVIERVGHPLFVVGIVGAYWLALR